MTSGEPSPLAARLAARIRAEGPITFADYMRACLYDPEYGYYSRPESKRFADFYTSVDVHSVFGRLLARQLAEMWRLLDRPTEFTAVEAGAATGRLAAQVLDFSRRELPDFYGALRYVAVEQSAARRARHTETIATHLAAGRAYSNEVLPAEIPAGCIFSNELFDALPVHRIVFESGSLREVFVELEAADGEALRETLGPPSTPELEAYFQKQGIALQEGQQAEVCLDACRWIADAGHRLGRGFVLTVDYGHPAKELYNERHMRGTLLAYAEHRASEEFLRAPGMQDLTAHVNFTALDFWGRLSGLAPTGLVSQMQFLLALGKGNEFEDLYEPGASEADRVRSRLLLKTLIHPEGMGETFHVFIQHKGVVDPQLTGLAGL